MFLLISYYTYFIQSNFLLLTDHCTVPTHGQPAEAS